MSHAASQWRSQAHLKAGWPVGDCPELEQLVNPQFTRAVMEQVQFREYMAREMAASTPVSSCSRCRSVPAPCCYQLVPCTSEEATLLLWAHAPLLQERWPHILQAAALQARLGIAYPTERTERNRRCDAWWNERQMCPFMAASGRCAVYSVRPVACLGYLVSTPPARCWMDVGQPAPKIGMLMSPELLRGFHSMNAYLRATIPARHVRGLQWYGLSLALVETVRRWVEFGTLAAADWPMPTFNPNQTEGSR